MQKITPQDIRFMRRALWLAEKGRGRVHPNPLVGAVLVKDNRIVAEGAHEFFGGPHAEVNAVRKAGILPLGCTLYTTLEPCDHFGKTPPCSRLILANGIRRVVVGAKDPNPLVSGKGMRRLKRAGVRVDFGVLRAEAEFLNKDFSRWVTKKLPFVTLKIAQSLDGKIATAAGESKWITGGPARRFSQGLRARADAVLVGVNTVLRDDPRLSVRLPGARKQPLKVVLDTSLKTPMDSRIFSGKKSAPVWIFTTRRSSPARRRAFSKKAEVIMLKERGKGKVDIKDVLVVLAQKGVVHVLIEGGGEVIASVLEQHLANEAYVFIAPKIIGGINAKSAVAGPGAGLLSKSWTFKRWDVKKVGNDFLLHGEF